jgi:cytochrome c oxidase cbb3-type subunit III
VRPRLLTIDRRRFPARCRPGAVSAVLCGLTLLVGCGQLDRYELPGKPKAADRPVPSDRITDFALLYQTQCAGCHGADGQLGPAPPLNDAMFLAIVPTEELLSLVDRGRPGTPMPGFAQRHGGPLTDEQVHVLAEGIKTKWGKPKNNPGEAAGRAADVPAYVSAPPAGHEVAEAVTRGRQLFATACGDCHGSDGQGDSAGPIKDPNFLALTSDQMLRRIIITGREDLGMPDYASTDGRPDDFKPLTSAQIDDLVALLGQWRSATPETSGAVAAALDRAKRRTTE